MISAISGASNETTSSDEPPSLGIEKLNQKTLTELKAKGYEVKIVSDIDSCKVLWKEFSSFKTIFDTWEFRYAFWKGFGRVPYFVAISKQDANVGLFPLWFEADNNRFIWFGSWWQEETKILVKDDTLVDLLLDLAPAPLHLGSISSETVKKSANPERFKKDDSKYILDLKKYNTLDSVLNNLKKKRRYNMKRDRRVIESRNPVVVRDRFEDLDHLIRLSKARLKEKGQLADWEDPRQIEAFRNVVELGKIHDSYDIRMLSVEIDGEIMGVDLILLYNKIYAPIKCGYDVDNCPGIGNFLNLYEIEDALAGGFEKMDFLAVNNGWKDKWLEEVPLYVFEK
ncbi:GNAT family N-acetyltransferase [Candidatus Dojkabacteria bacterium]|nr:GNAT family N-acetyltransferase [Candidatus Dojkabacteria bacterium]